MNKKGFTLTELLVSIVILSIISLMVLPNLFSLINSNHVKDYESYEMLVKSTLEMYNIDKKEDLWSDNNNAKISFADLKKLYPNTSLTNEECIVDGDLEIIKQNKTYKYVTCIVCKDYKSKDCN